MTSDASDAKYTLIVLVAIASYDGRTVAEICSNPGQRRDCILALSEELRGVQPWAKLRGG